MGGDLMKYNLHTAILFLAGCALASSCWPEEPGNHEALTKEDIAKITKSEFSPYAGRNFPTC